MKFYEALKLADEGAKIASKGMASNTWYEKRDGILNYFDGFKYQDRVFSITNISYFDDGWFVYKEPLLTKEERIYLEAVLESYKNCDLEKLRRLKQILGVVIDDEKTLNTLKGKLSEDDFEDICHLVQYE